MNSSVYIHIVTVCIQNLFRSVLTVVPFHKSCDKCFDRSGPLLQIRSHIFNSGCLTNQVTNVLTEVIPFYKSGHICRHVCTTIYYLFSL